MQGTLRKLKSSLTEPVQYHLPVGDELVDLNALIGKQLTLTFSGTILCSNCGKKTKKSYSQGHCFVCMRKLASCDMCIMKPETCHYDQGTCREPQWGEENCMIPHYVYLANTSGLKGYFASVVFQNNSKKEAKLFSVGALAELSSK